jgi:hypothetical protein
MPRSPSKPSSPKSADDLPHPLTFFLTQAQRRRVIAALRALHRDRITALHRALRIQPGPAALPARPDTKERA